MPFDTIGSPLLWAGFVGFVLLMLALDLGVLHRRARTVTLREAGVWSAVWVAIAALFGAFVRVRFGPARALELATGYLIEKALAVDNILAIAMVFAALSIPAASQRRVLFWGVLGALGMRAAFIVGGGALLSAFHGAIYVFGALLVIGGARMLVQGEKAGGDQSAILRLVRRVVPVTYRLHGDRFLVREGGVLLATPLLLALVVIEVTDLVFAAESLPAVFAVSRDPFIVFTSNVLAMLGLRSMYFLLAGAIGRYHLLKPALALVLVFTGAKMILVDVLPISTGASLALVALILGGAMVLSVLRRPAAEPDPVSTG